MKKLVYLLAVTMGAAMFAACGSSENKEAADAVEEVAVEEVVDSVAAPVDSVAAPADSVVAE